MRAWRSARAAKWVGECTFFVWVGGRETFMYHRVEKKDLVSSMESRSK